MRTINPVDLTGEDRRRRDATAYRRLVVATLPIFLLLSAVYVLAAAIGLVADDGGPISIVERARAKAHAVIPFVFMG